MQTTTSTAHQKGNSPQTPQLNLNSEEQFPANPLDIDKLHEILTNLSRQRESTKDPARRRALEKKIAHYTPAYLELNMKLTGAAKEVTETGERILSRNRARGNSVSSLFRPAYKKLVEARQQKVTIKNPENEPLASEGTPPTKIKSAYTVMSEIFVHQEKVREELEQLNQQNNEQLNEEQRRRKTEHINHLTTSLNQNIKQIQDLSKPLLIDLKQEDELMQETRKLWANAIHSQKIAEWQIRRFKAKISIQEDLRKIAAKLEALTGEMEELKETMKTKPETSNETNKLASRKIQDSYEQVRRESSALTDELDGLISTLSESIQQLKQDQEQGRLKSKTHFSNEVSGVWLHSEERYDSVFQHQQDAIAQEIKEKTALKDELQSKWNRIKLSKKRLSWEFQRIDAKLGIENLLDKMGSRFKSFDIKIEQLKETMRNRPEISQMQNKNTLNKLLKKWDELAAESKTTKEELDKQLSLIGKSVQPAESESEPVQAPSNRLTFANEREMGERKDLCQRLQSRWEKMLNYDENLPSNKSSILFGLRRLWMAIHEFNGQIPLMSTFGVTWSFSDECEEKVKSLFNRD